MKYPQLIPGLVLLSCLLAAPLQARKPELPNPDFTKGESIPEGATKDWNLGATGMRGCGRTITSRMRSSAR